MNDVFRISRAALSALAGGALLFVASAFLVGFVIGPANDMHFGFLGSILFGFCAMVFGIIAGAVAGASEDTESDVAKAAAVGHI
jgi:hypothetical protein